MTMSLQLLYITFHYITFNGWQSLGKKNLNRWSRWRSAHGP